MAATAPQGHPYSPVLLILSRANHPHTAQTITWVRSLTSKRQVLQGGALRQRPCQGIGPRIADLSTYHGSHSI
eukprot:scaffold21648_cov18-Prasinocladus_malaysianus.AAC.1